MQFSSCSASTLPFFTFPVLPKQKQNKTKTKLPTISPQISTLEVGGRLRGGDCLGVGRLVGFDEVDSFQQIFLTPGILMVLPRTDAVAELGSMGSPRQRRWP